MASKQVVFKPDEVKRLQQQIVRIGADTDALRRRVSGKIASWDRPLPVLGSLEQIQRQLTSLTQEAEQMTEVISKALKGIERVQAEAAQEAKQLAKGLSGLERFDLLKRVGTTGGGSYTPVPVAFRPMVTNLIDRILPQASRDRWSSDPLVKELRRVAGLQGATAAEKLDAEMKLEAIFAERDLIAKAQTAYAVYKQFGNHLLMAEMRKQAEISREKLKALGVAEIYFAPNVNMTSYFKQVPLLACDYDPSFALEGDMTTRVPLPDNARYLFMVMMAQTPGPMGELAKVQLKEIHQLQQTIRDAAGGLVTDVQQGKVKSGLLQLLTILQSMQALSKYDPPPKEVIVEEKPGVLEKFGQDAMRTLELNWTFLKNQAAVEWAAIKQTGNSIAEVATDLYHAHVERSNKSNDSVYDFFNNATMGLLSVPEAFWKEHVDRTANKNESVSAYLDYLSLGLTGMVQGAFAPENPNSKEHLLNVLGILSLMAPFKGKSIVEHKPSTPKIPDSSPEVKVKTGVGATGEGIPIEKVKPKVLDDIYPDPSGAYGYLPKEGTAYSNIDFKDVNKAKDNQIIRKEYLEQTNKIEARIADMKANGSSAEEIAKTVVEMRNHDKVAARKAMAAEEVVELEKRNIKKYGNPIGPDADWLFQNIKIKMEKINPEVSDKAVWNAVIEGAMRKDEVINTLLGIDH
ncbi:hypothetical protein [Paenibacillus sp. BIHB 4019]|uniref:hypothetical protein n=1 Tax=Paenibacillus sp. BIHB 4019 TaxID=1870819 RepID=UPI001F33C9D6|nr:hypothetical protein [Paenibacillus sp. BIHB 4019]